VITDALSFINFIFEKIKNFFKKGLEVLREI